MPKYLYKAKTEEGEDLKGELVAENSSEVARLLREKGLILISTKRLDKKKKVLSFSLPFFNDVSLSEKMMITRNLRVMISAGLPLPRALKVLSEQTKNKKLVSILKGISKGLREGKSFSDCLAEHKDVFSDLYLSMVRVGEKGGTLEDSLGVLSRQMERQHELKSEITGALIYPSVIILAMCGIGAAMIVLVVPKIAATFEELGTELPATTKFVIGLGTAVSSYWYLFLVGGLGLVVLFSQLLKMEAVKRVTSYIGLKAPFISDLVKKINAAYTLRSLSSLISAGVPLPESLDVMATTSSNYYYQKAIRRAREEVKKGEKLSNLLEGKGIYPSLVIQMLAVGEETGETSTILDKLADFYEDQVARSMKNLASVIEPVIMLLIGGVVGFFAISMIQPMYSMLSAIQ